MAHLLGHRGCMESLRADLGDLQAAIAQVSSRAGAVRFRSWKFPDKVSAELDLPTLLERYSYSETDPEFTQHAHLVLLELVIDRLLLLLQSSTGYAEKLLGERAVPPARAVGPCVSVGLTARTYCCTTLRLGTTYQQLLAEKAARGKETPTLQPTPQAGKPGGNHQKHCQPAKSTPNVPTQAAGLSRGPCDTCGHVQASLQDVGKAIASLCRSQNIPSALSRFQELLEKSPGRTLSARDVRYWASEQSKDLSRLSKHLQMVLQQVDPLRSQLVESQKQRDELQKELEDVSQMLRVEKETRARQRREAEHSLETKNREHLEAVARLERDKEDLRRGAALLEERLSTLEEELAAEQGATRELEGTKAALEEERRTTMVARSQVLELEEKVQLLMGQQENLGQELGATTTQLEKEKAKVESVLRHQESLQAKQRALLEQLDSLDQEREELLARLGEAEEDTARLAESREQLRAQQVSAATRGHSELLDALRQEKRSLEQSVPELQANVTKLEEQARELKERERLLVLFPELHIPAEAQMESTGSWTEDMEKQLQANSIRIHVLEQENVRLRAALAKVKVAAEQGVLKLVPQSQLWPGLGSQQGGEPSRPDTGRPSSRGSRGSSGTQGRQWHPKPWGRAGPCLSLPATAPVLSPPEPRGSSRARPPPLTAPAGGARGALAGDRLVHGLATLSSKGAVGEPPYPSLSEGLGAAMGTSPMPSTPLPPPCPRSGGGSVPAAVPRAS
ncbi:coiled-coil domain-containing protein 157 [Aegotheles albertisi]